MKKFIAMAIAAITIGGASASAQAIKGSGQKIDRTQTTEAATNNKMYQPQKFTDFAFEGILLDVNQQQRIDSLNAAMEAQRQAMREGRGKACADSANCPNKANCPKANKECQKDGQKCQKDGMRAGRKGMRGDRSEYVKKVKEILTPDQYTMFLENIVFMPENQGPKMQDMRKGAKAMKKADKAAKKADKAVKKAEKAAEKANKATNK